MTQSLVGLISWQSKGVTSSESNADWSQSHWRHLKIWIKSWLTLISSFHKFLSFLSTLNPTSPSQDPVVSDLSIFISSQAKPVQTWASAKLLSVLIRQKKLSRLLKTEFMNKLVIEPWFYQRNYFKNILSWSSKHMREWHMATKNSIQILISKVSSCFELHKKCLCFVILPILCATKWLYTSLSQN